jgi:hypothetical protein
MSPALVTATGKQRVLNKYLGLRTRTMEPESRVRIPAHTPTVWPPERQGWVTGGWLWRAASGYNCHSGFLLGNKSACQGFGQPCGCGLRLFSAALSVPPRAQEHREYCR